MNPMTMVIMNNSLIEWGIALGVTFIIAATLFLVKKIVVQHLKKIAARTSTHLDDVAVGMLSSTRLTFITIMAFYISSSLLDVPDAKQVILNHIVVIALFIQLALWADKGVRMWLSNYVERTRMEDAASTTSTAAIGFIVRVALWVIAILMILDNLGFNITTLVASLGIGGIAVALAMQNILGDLFASLSIVLDKPFSVGDFIIVDDAMGTVEFVGLKTTRLRSISGEQIICSNSDLLKSRIRNYKRMQERRAVFTLGVVYHSTQEQLKMIPTILRETIEAQERTRFDRAHFKAYGDSSLDFEVVYYVAVPDYALYMDIQQAVNLAIFKRFADEGIEFAFPSRTVYMVNPPAEEGGAAQAEAAPAPQIKQ